MTTGPINGQSDQIALRLPHADMERARAIAARTGRTLSRVLKEAIRAGLPRIAAARPVPAEPAEP